MLFELSTGWIVLLNVLGWPVLHFAISALVTLLPHRLFRPGSFWYRRRAFEDGGQLYERLLKVSRWKKKLPDGAKLLGGFSKKRLRSRRPHYLRRFVRETCRGELAHLLTIAAAPIFLLWNEPWVLAVMLLYAILANLPFIVVQRHNRFRLEDTLSQAREAEPDRRSSTPRASRRRGAPLSAPLSDAGQG